MFPGFLVWLWTSHVTIVTFSNSKHANICGGSLLGLINSKLYTVVLLMTQLYAKNSLQAFSFHCYKSLKIIDILKNVTISDTQTDRHIDRQTRQMYNKIGYKYRHGKKNSYLYL